MQRVRALPASLLLLPAPPPPSLFFPFRPQRAARATSHVVNDVNKGLLTPTPRRRGAARCPAVRPLNPRPRIARKSDRQARGRDYYPGRVIASDGLARACERTIIIDGVITRRSSAFQFARRIRGQWSASLPSLGRRKLRARGGDPFLSLTLSRRSDEKKIFFLILRPWQYIIYGR